MSESDVDALVDRPQLRVDLLTPVVQVAPGQPVTIVLQVANQSAVIEQIDVRLLGVMAESVLQTPNQVTLFPDERMRVTLDVTFHRSLPAGTHHATILIAGRAGSAVASEQSVTLEVPPHPSAVLRAEPPVRTAGRRGMFELELENTGNTELSLLLQATDADRVLDLSLSQRKVNLRVDQTAYATLVAYRKRPWAGSPVEHTIAVTAEGDDVEEQAEVRFRQKAVLTPGVITILTLALVVLLWAFAMLFGVRAALSPPEPVKAVPETFMQGTRAQDLDPATVGGQIVGTVRAQSTEQAVPLVTIEAFNADGELVTATASDDDGTYELAGLIPARYRLRVRAAGFEEQWWPGVPSAADAGEVLVAARAPTEGTDVLLAGLPSSLGGQVFAGDGTPLTVTVEVVALDLVEGEPPITTTTDDGGIWRVDGLTAPATYRITYTAPGYAPVEVTEALPAGEELLLSSERLPAAPGSIAGRVEDRDGTPLGGVEIVAQRGDDEISTITPTSGEVGIFALADLETPGTYLVTFTADGFASETQGVRLGPGETITGLTVVLSRATGTIRGQATSSTGEPLGGVRITVTGGGVTQTTDTLTSGAVGSYSVSGLPLPGIYTVTFDLDGFGRESVQVQLDPGAPEGAASAVLTSAVGRLTGVVVDATSGDPIAGAEVEVSDGEFRRTTTTASAPSAQTGRFTMSGLAPGSYTVTATTPGGSTVTILETIVAAQTVDVRLEVDTS